MKIFIFGLAGALLSLIGGFLITIAPDAPNAPTTLITFSFLHNTAYPRSFVLTSLGSFLLVVGFVVSTVSLWLSSFKKQTYDGL